MCLFFFSCQMRLLITFTYIYLTNSFENWHWENKYKNRDGGWIEDVLDQGHLHMRFVYFIDIFHNIPWHKCFSIPQRYIICCIFVCLLNKLMLIAINKIVIKSHRCALVVNRLYWIQHNSIYNILNCKNTHIQYNINKIKTYYLCKFNMRFLWNVIVV